MYKYEVGDTVKFYDYVTSYDSMFKYYKRYLTGKIVRRVVHTAHYDSTIYYLIKIQNKMKNVRWILESEVINDEMLIPKNTFGNLLND